MDHRSPGSILRIGLYIVEPIVLFSLLNVSLSINFINRVIGKGSSSIAFVLVPTLFLFLAQSRKGWIRHIYIIGFLSIFYGLLLKWYWTTGYTNTTHLWGYLPTSDPSIYSSEAYGLLSGNAINGAATFRPLYTLFYSSLLWLSNLNPMISLWAMVYLNVFGSLISSNEIRKTHGPFAAAVFLTGGMLFYRFWIGTIMTEQLGFMLGNIAFASFWNGISNKNIKKVLVGVFVLSLGLNIRAGAMLILLFLPIWIGLHFRTRKFAFKWAFFAVLIVTSGFIFNTIATKFFITNRGTMFSNFGLTLYGVSVGNKGYTQFYVDHPGIPASESTQIAIQQIMDQPTLFLKGVGRTYLDYFNPSTCWAFCFLRFSTKIPNFVLMVFFMIGLIYIIANWRKPIPFFLLFSLVGIFLSVPFAPTRDVGYRSYTITNPILFSTLFIGFPWATQLWGRIRNLSPGSQQSINEFENESEYLYDLTYPLIILVIGLSLVLPAITFRLKPLLQPSPQLNCQPDEISFSFMTNRNAWIHVVPQEYLAQGISIPYATPDALEKIVVRSPYHSERSFTGIISYAYPGSSIGYAPYYFPSSTSTPRFTQVLLIVNTSNLPDKTGLIQACGEDVTTIVAGKVYINKYIAADLNFADKSIGSKISQPGVQRMSLFSIIFVIITITFECLASMTSLWKVQLSQK